MATRKGGSAVAKLSDKRHEIEQLETTLAERQAALGEVNERLAGLNTELTVATAESRRRLADIEEEIEAANAQRESMLTCTLVTMHATRVYEWLQEATPGQRLATVLLGEDGAIDLHFTDGDGESVDGPEKPEPEHQVEPAAVPA